MDNSVEKGVGAYFEQLAKKSQTSPKTGGEAQTVHAVEAKKQRRIKRILILIPVIALMSFISWGVIDSIRYDMEYKEVERLRTELEDGDKDVRINAINALAKIGVESEIGADVNAAHAIAVALGDTDEDISRAAIDAFVRLGIVKSDTALHNVLCGDADALTKQNAITAFVRLGDRSSVMELVNALYDSDDAVRKSATDALIAVMQDNYYMDLRPAAVVVLGKIGDERAVEPLVTVFEEIWETYYSDDDLCLALARALAMIGNERTMDALLTVYKNNIDDYRIRTDLM